MDPAPGRPRRPGQHVDEGGDVVVGDRLALLHRLDREGRAARIASQVGLGRPVDLLGGGDLDPPPGLHLAPRRPDGARARGGCSADHASRIRAARIAGVPGVVEADAGDRHARRHLRDRQHRVEAARGRQAARQRHADDRQVGVRGDHAGQRRRQPGAGDDHAQAAHPRVLGVVGDRVGLAVGATSRGSRSGCRASSSSSPAFSISAMSDFEPMTMPTRGGPTRGPRTRPRLGLARRLGLGDELGLADSAHAGRLGSTRAGRRCRGASACRRSRSRPRQHRRLARGAPASAPSAVTLSTRPPAVTHSPSRSRGPGVGHLGAARDRRRAR